MKDNKMGKEELANELINFLAQSSDSVSDSSLPSNMSDSAKGVWQTEMVANNVPPPVKVLVTLRERIANSKRSPWKLASIGLIPSLGAALVVLAAVLLFPARTGFIQLTSLEANTWHDVAQKTSYKHTGLDIQVHPGSSVAHKDTDNFHFHVNEGKAHFDIDKEELGKPFVVWMPGGFVRTLGTKFKVHVDGNSHSIAVTQGKIAIHKAIKDGTYKETILTAGNEASFKKNKKADHHDVDPDSVNHDKVLKKHVSSEKTAKEKIKNNPKKKKGPAKETGPFANAIGKAIVVKLDNGDVTSGKLLSAKGATLKIKSQVGTIQVNKSEIESWKPKL